MHVIQLVPNLPPKIDGIGDNALLLAKRLRDNHQATTTFVATNPAWQGPQSVENFNIVKLESHNARRLRDLLLELSSRDSACKSSVILHFGAYGYQKRGCPFWLLAAIKGFKQASSGTLLTMFHELDARTTSLLKSSFYLAPVQRYIISHIAKHSDYLATNTTRYVDRLKFFGAGPAALLPIYSGIGEPDLNPPLSERKRQLIIFGRPWQRQMIYKDTQPILKPLCTALNLNMVIDIGAPIPDDSRDEWDGIPISRLGVLPPHKVSEMMHRSTCCMIAYPTDLLTKSSVFGAVCAHGTVPIIYDPLCDTYSTTDVHEGTDFLYANTGSISFDDTLLQTVSTSTFLNYKNRNSDHAAQLVFSMLGGFESGN